MAQIIGVVLTGGAGRRIGRTKGDLVLNGRTGGGFQVLPVVGRLHGEGVGGGLDVPADDAALILNGDHGPLVLGNNRVYHLNTSFESKVEGRVSWRDVPSTCLLPPWQDDAYQKGNIEKVLVLGIVNKEKPLLRRNFEDGMAKAFNDAGISATPSMDHMPYDVAIDSTTFEKYFKELLVDAVVVSRLVAVDASRDYTAGYLYRIPYNSYYGFYGYYYAGVSMANVQVIFPRMW